MNVLIHKTLVRRPHPYVEGRVIEQWKSKRLSLPGIPSAKRRRFTRNTEVECCVCLEGFKAGKSDVLELDCSHLFHEYCIRKYLTVKRNCPYCREPITTSACISPIKNADEYSSDGEEEPRMRVRRHYRQRSFHG